MKWLGKMVKSEHIGRNNLKFFPVFEKSKHF